jgi:hypothetical protein
MVPARLNVQGDGMKNKSIIMATLMLGAASAAAQQPAQMTYRCTGADGKRYYGATVPEPCLGQPIEQLNMQGLVVRRIDPQASEKERQQKQLELARKREEDAAAREAGRRNRALLATYTSEKDIDDARGRALAENRTAVKEIEARIAELKKRQVGYEKELEFYQGKAKPPGKLEEDIKNAEIDFSAQEELLAAKKKEVDSINSRYDEDKRRYAELTKQK